MIDMAPLIQPSAIEFPKNEARAELVRSKKSRRKAATIAAIGSIIILSDGRQCQVVGYDQQGQPLCVPIDE